MKRALQIQTKPNLSAHRAKAENATANTKCQCYDYEDGSKSVTCCELYLLYSLFFSTSHIRCVAQKKLRLPFKSVMTSCEWYAMSYHERVLSSCFFPPCCYWAVKMRVSICPSGLGCGVKGEYVFSIKTQEETQH